MAKTNIWMPVYWADYMNDTSMLSLCEHGAYMMLLKEYWQQGGALENDRERIYRACKAIGENDQRNINYILDKFFHEKSGKFINKRADLELKKAKKNKKARSEAGRLSGVARRTNVQQKYEQNTERTPEQNANPTPSPTLSELSNDNSNNTRRGTRINPELKFDGEYLEEAKKNYPAQMDIMPIVFKEFVDYWIGISGKAGVKLDWPATWRNRLKSVNFQIIRRNQNDRNTNSNGRGNAGRNAGNTRTTGVHEGFQAQDYKGTTGAWGEVIGGDDS
jgi:uncharacterized protein YdaU (DUF1376 family)